MFGFWSFVVIAVAAIAGGVSTPFILKWVSDNEIASKIQKARADGKREEAIRLTVCCKQPSNGSSLPHQTNFKDFTLISVSFSALTSARADELNPWRLTLAGRPLPYQRFVPYPVMVCVRTGIPDFYVVQVGKILVPYNTCDKQLDVSDGLTDFSQFAVTSCPKSRFRQLGPLVSWGWWYCRNSCLISPSATAKDQAAERQDVVFLGRSQVGKSKLIKQLTDRPLLVGRGEESVTSRFEATSIAHYRLIDSVGFLDTREPAVADVERPLRLLMEYIRKAGIGHVAPAAYVFVSIIDDGALPYVDFPLLDECRRLFVGPTDLVHFVWDGSDIESATLWLRLADGKSKMLAYNTSLPASLLNIITTFQLQAQSIVDKLPLTEQLPALGGFGQAVYDKMKRLESIHLRDETDAGSDTQFTVSVVINPVMDKFYLSWPPVEGEPKRVHTVIEVPKSAKADLETQKHARRVTRRNTLHHKVRQLELHEIHGARGPTRRLAWLTKYKHLMARCHELGELWDSALADPSSIVFPNSDKVYDTADTSSYVYYEDSSDNSGVFQPRSALVAYRTKRQENRGARERRTFDGVVLSPLMAEFVHAHVPIPRTVAFDVTEWRLPHDIDLKLFPEPWVTIVDPVCSRVTATVGYDSKVAPDYNSAFEYTLSTWGLGVRSKRNRSPKPKRPEDSEVENFCLVAEIDKLNDPRLSGVAFRDHLFAAAKHDPSVYKQGFFSAADLSSWLTTLPSPHFHLMTFRVGQDDDNFIVEPTEEPGILIKNGANAHWFGALIVPPYHSVDTRSWSLLTLEEHLKRLPLSHADSTVEDADSDPVKSQSSSAIEEFKGNLMRLVEALASAVPRDTALTMRSLEDQLVKIENEPDRQACGENLNRLTKKLNDIPLVSITTPVTGPPHSVRNASSYKIRFDSDGDRGDGTRDAVWWQIPALSGYTWRKVGIEASAVAVDITVPPTEVAKLPGPYGDFDPPLRYKVMNRSPATIFADVKIDDLELGPWP